MAVGRSPKKGSASSSSATSLSRSATFDDIPKDAEDLFETGRDQILLDHDDRQVNSDDDMDVGLDDHEVLGINAQRSDDSDQGDEEDDDYAMEVEDQDDVPQSKKQKGKKTINVSSDEDDDDFDDEDEDEDDVHENDRGWGTNKRAYYNTNDLDAIDSDSEIDEEQARELEVKEVKRLQRKSRSAMDDADFGLGEDDVEGAVGKAARDAGREQRRKELDENESTTTAKAAPSSSPSQTSAAPTPLPQDPSTRQALLAKLQSTSPETVALAGEYADMIEEFARVDDLLKKMTTTNPKFAGLELVHLHHQTLVTYITTMTYYFHLRASPEYATEPAKLRSHPVLTRMMRLKQGLSTMEDLGLTLDGPRSVGVEGDQMDEMYSLSQGSEDDDLGDLDEDELAELLADADEKENAAPRGKKLKKSSTSTGRKSKANGKNGILQPLEDDSDDEYLNDGSDDEYMDEAPSSKRKAKKGSAAARKEKKTKSGKEKAVAAPLAAGLADLDDEPAPEVKIKKSKKAANAAGNPFAMSSSSRDLNDATFGELSELSSIDQAERAARKRSLQFHASAIENKALQRSRAAKDRQSGDADIPYRDRERSRAGVEAAKAAREAKAQRMLGGAGAPRDTSLDGEDGWGESDEKDWREVMGQTTSSANGIQDHDNDEDDDAAGYYDLVSSSRKRARAEAKAEYDQARNEERFALMEDDVVEDGQHRGITRQIEKNKGLTPHRPKTSRNPRVKKRLKYEQAKKKLGSRQAVFKGGQASLQGGYGGEASGISTHLVKSRKLG